MESLNFINEAEAALKETAFGVKESCLSKSLPCSEAEVYINLTVLEGDRYCVHLDLGGYEIVGNDYNCIVDEVQKEGRVFETLTSLLDSVSPMYRVQFGIAICDKLKHLVDVSDEQQ